LNGDAIAPHIVSTVERDRRRNLAASVTFVKMLTAETAPDATHNRATIQAWLQSWGAAAIAAAQALAPVFAHVKHITFDQAFDTALGDTTRICAELGFTLGR
jgi:hypothetical protein